MFPLLLRLSLRTRDYVSLTKPGLTLMAVGTAVGGAYLCGAREVGILFHTLVGTLLAGSGALVLNQYVERELDRQMMRTSHRALPSGRLIPRNALRFGLLLAPLGVAYLLVEATPLAAILACATICIYVLVYTPLKRITPIATIVGAVPGALPPMIGWAAVTGRLDVGAWVLFALLFFWQLSHFLALSWVYKNDYARAGFRLLSVLDTTGRRVAFWTLVSTALLLVASVLPGFTGQAGRIFTVGAFCGGTLLLILAVRFKVQTSSVAARRIFIASLFYLPFLIALAALDSY